MNKHENTGSNAGFVRLEKMIVDLIQEEQIKLGYAEETIHLYFPADSLSRILACPPAACVPAAEGGDGIILPAGPVREPDRLSGDLSDLQAVLDAFADFAAPSLGQISVTHSRGGRFHFMLPAEAARYVHTHHGSNSFLQELVAVVRCHDSSLEDLFSVFRKYGNDVRIERQSGPDFDYLVWFGDGIPDDYRYCITDEGHHLIYHRYTAADYRDLFADATT